MRTTRRQAEIDQACGRVAPWKGSFDVDGVDGGAIDLAQVDRNTFALSSSLCYRGEKTGLEGKGLSPEVLERMRTVNPKDTPTGVICTDLASVPGPTRWFLGRYGEHTPAVIIHDELIPTPADLPGMNDAYADRYLRFMLADLGVRLLKRWVTWAAVALRSRFAAGGWRRWLVVVWLVAAADGITTFGFAWANGDARLLWLSAAAPALFAGLWGRQYGAGLVAAIAAPWLLPPTVLALLGYLVYLALEWIGDQIVHVLVRLGRIPPDKRDTGTYVPGGF